MLLSSSINYLNVILIFPILCYNNWLKKVLGWILNLEFKRSQIEIDKFTCGITCKISDLIFRLACYISWYFNHLSLLEFQYMH